MSSLSLGSSSNETERESLTDVDVREQIGGPMWGAPIHNREFVKEMLDHVEENSKDFKTSERIKGMLTVAYNVRSDLHHSAVHESSRLMEERVERRNVKLLYTSLQLEWLATSTLSVLPFTLWRKCLYSPCLSAFFLVQLANHERILHSSALLNANYTVSRSHAQPGSIKTNAPRLFVHDIIREWIKLNPVKMSNVKDGSPAKLLLAKEQT